MRLLECYLGLLPYHLYPTHNLPHFFPADRLHFQIYYLCLFILSLPHIYQLFKILLSTSQHGLLTCQHIYIYSHYLFDILHTQPGSVKVFVPSLLSNVLYSSSYALSFSLAIFAMLNIFLYSCLIVCLLASFLYRSPFCLPTYAIMYCLMLPPSLIVFSPRGPSLLLL